MSEHKHPVSVDECVDCWRKWQETVGTKNRQRDAYRRFVREVGRLCDELGNGEREARYIATLLRAALARLRAELGGENE